MVSTTILRIDSLLRHIDKIFDDTKGLTIEDLKKNDLLLRATCFSIAQIGEMMVQLEKELKQKHSSIPWGPARGMRNTIVHDYIDIDVEEVYSTINKDLPLLKASFLEIRKEIV